MCWYAWALILFKVNTMMTFGMPKHPARKIKYFWEKLSRNNQTHKAFLFRQLDLIELVIGIGINPTSY